MTRGTSKVTGTGISQCQLQNAHGGTRCRIKRRSQCDPGKEIKGTREFPIHFILSQGLAQNKMKSLIHPSKSLSVAEEFHEQGRTAENGHGGDELVFGSKVIQTGKEDTKGSVHEFSTHVVGIAVLTVVSHNNITWQNISSNKRGEK